MKLNLGGLIDVNLVHSLPKTVCECVNMYMENKRGLNLFCTMGFNKYLKVFNLTIIDSYLPPTLIFCRYGVNTMYLKILKIRKLCLRVMTLLATFFCICIGKLFLDKMRFSTLP